MAEISAYLSVSIAFEVKSRVLLPPLIVSKGSVIESVSVEPWLKDYDRYETPADLPAHFDTSKWAILSALEEETRIGGAIVGRDSPGFDMMRGRRDLAVLIDIRIDPRFRGLGFGSAIFAEATNWALRNGCRDLIVETQDTNLVACKFYQATGCELESVEEDAFGNEAREAKLIWRRRLS